MTDTTPDTDSPEDRLLTSLVKDGDILTPVVMIGASALIPVPFLDDVAKAYLEKRLFAKVAARKEVSLSKEEKQGLTQDKDPRGCCALGCLGSALLYPLKKLLRKIFFFLEVKRCVDQSTTALAEAFLFAVTLEKELWQPGGPSHDAECVRRAIRHTCRSQGVKPLEASIRHGFEGARGLFGDFAAKFVSKGTGEDEEQMERAVESLEQEESAKLAGLTKKLTVSLEKMPDSYLERFAASFAEQLALERARPAPNPK